MVGAVFLWGYHDFLKNYFFRALLISLSPLEQANGDRIISIPTLPEGLDVEALIIRTLPNSDSKKSLNYADTNPPFLALDGIKVLNDLVTKFEKVLAAQLERT